MQNGCRIDASIELEGKESSTWLQCRFTYCFPWKIKPQSKQVPGMSQT